MGRVTPGQGVTAIVFGVLEIILGIVIIICGFVAAAKIDNALYSPYWAGFVYIVPGILGIITGATKSNGCMIAFMVLNIVVFVLFGVVSIAICIVVGAYSTVISEVTNYCQTVGTYCVCNYNGQSYNFKGDCNALTTLVAGLWAVVVSCFLSAVITFASSILGCVSACCTPAQVPNLIVQEHPSGIGGFAQPPQYQPAQMYQPPQPPQPQGKAGMV